MSNYRRPVATEIETDEKCEYGCQLTANYRFMNGMKCCSKHQNSCAAKRLKFSLRTDHKGRAEKSLETRLRLGITKSCQIKSKATREANGSNDRMRILMQQRWIDNPWNNNQRHCPVLSYKGLDLYFQGTYELDFLENLEKQNGLTWIKENVTRGPNLWYYHENIKRLYISDFLIGNTIYEIKSAWTWNKKGSDLKLEKRNKEKFKAAISKGYIIKLILDKIEMEIIDFD